MTDLSSQEKDVEPTLQNGVKVYGISKYYFDKNHIKKSPSKLIGYATMTESDK